MSALKGHPKGLYLIFATSTAERFSYYGMRAIFILFLTQALLFDKEAAAVPSRFPFVFNHSEHIKQCL